MTSLKRIVTGFFFYLKDSRLEFSQPLQSCPEFQAIKSKNLLPMDILLYSASRKNAEVFFDVTNDHPFQLMITNHLNLWLKVCNNLKTQVTATRKTLPLELD